MRWPSEARVVRAPLCSEGPGRHAGSPSPVGPSGPGVRGLSPLSYHVFEITRLVDTLRAQPRCASSPGLQFDGDGDSDLLASGMSRLAAESAHVETRAVLLSHLATLAPTVIAGCDGGSVTLRRGDYLVTAAASDDTVRHLDGIQYAGHDGPCVDATENGVQVHVANLAGEQRWLTFTAQARDHGMASVLSTPVVTGDDQAVGALNLYSRTPTAFRAADRDLARVFASLTAAACDEPADTAAHHFGARIRDALASRDVIAQAQGVLMERLGVHADGAYDALRRDAVEASMPLRARAGEIVAGVNAATPPGPSHDQTMSDRPLGRARRDARLSVTELWFRYVALGGDSTPVELEAHLHGALKTSAHDHDVIAHAIHERHLERRGGHASPPSDESG